MKILERYILGEFLKMLAMAVAAFIALFLMIDVFENMDKVLKHGVPAGAAALFFLYRVPAILAQVMPIACLVATLVSLGLLSKHGEITAMRSGGIRLLRSVAPLIAAGAVISLLVVVMNESITPAAARRADLFRTKWFGMQGGSFGSSGLWMRTRDGILNVREADFRRNELHGVTFYEIERPFGVQRRVAARLAVLKDGKWIAPSAEVWTFQEGAGAQRSRATELRLEGAPLPVDMANAENVHRNMNILELNSYVKGLVRDGYNATRYQIDLYGKLTFPLVNLVMVLVGIPFALLKTGRHAGIAVGIGLSVIIAFSYWVVFAVMRSLGINALVPPIVAAAFPDVLFAAVGALMFGYVRE